MGSNSMLMCSILNLAWKRVREMEMEGERRARPGTRT